VENAEGPWPAKGACYASAVPSARVISIDEPALRALYDALDALRRAEEPFDPRNDGAWRVVAAWARGRAPARDRRHDDVVQETLLAIARYVREMEASSPRQAAKWATTILRRKQIDVLRQDAVDAVARGLDEGDATLDAITAEEPTVPPTLLDAQYRRIEEVVLASIEDEPSATVRLTRRSMARAAIYRFVLELEPEAVEARLALAEPIGKERLYKWIERGRALVADAMRDWADARPDESDVQAISGVVIELVEARRADAGKPRPERRKP
jgi:DNA-directed RNA polymerase specialized sigma24 family protein